LGIDIDIDQKAEITVSFAVIGEQFRNYYEYSKNIKGTQKPLPRTPRCP
jgi:hypothetical protein